MKSRTNDIDGGWAWVVLASGLGILFVVGFVSYSMGIINSAMLEVYEADVSWTSMVVATEIGLVNFVGPLAGVCINRFGCRICAILGGIIATIGLAGTSFARNLYTVMLTLGILTGLGYGLSYAAVVVQVGHSFDRLRPVATGISLSGAAVGMFVGPPVVQMLVDYYSLQGSYLILAGITSHLCVFGSLLRPLQQFDTKGKRNKESLKQRQWFKQCGRDNHCPVHIYKNLGFMLYLLSMLCWSLAESACFLHLPTYCIQQGSTKQQTSFLFTVMGIVNICSRILVGFAVNDERISKVTILFGQMTIAGVCTGLFPLYSRTYGGQMAYSAVLGIYSSGASSLMSPLAVEIVGLDNLATAFGLISLSFGAGCLTGPSIAGAIIDYGATYRESFIFAGAIYLMSGLLAILIPTVQRWKDNHVTGGRDFPGQDISDGEDDVNETPL